MKNFKNYLIFFICLFITLNVLAQDSTSVENEKYQKILDKTPSFSIYGDNYFATGTTIGKTPNSLNSDAKFQLGFKQIVTRSYLPFKTHLFFTYQQIAFWDIYADSFPFRDINYNPSIGFGKILFDEDNTVSGGLFLAFEHQSNGRDGENSRSWNYVSLSYRHSFSDKFQSTVEGWLPLGGLDNNKDLLEYIGYGKLTLSWRPKEILFFEGVFKKAIRTDWRGSAQLSVNLRYSKSTDQYIYLQYYVGQGESLLDYQKNSNYIRLGIAFKDLIFWD